MNGRNKVGVRTKYPSIFFSSFRATIYLRAKQRCYLFHMLWCVAQLTCDKYWILWCTDLWTISLFNYKLGGRIIYWATSMRFVFLVFYFFFLSRKSTLPQGGWVWGMNTEVVCADKLAYAFWKPGAWEGMEISGLPALKARMWSLWCLGQVAGWQDFCG